MYLPVVGRRFGGLPAPIEGITLADKQAVTKHLSMRRQHQRVERVRKQLSRVKGGRLARACRAGRLRTLIISDVLGDPLDVIASGPTVPDRATAPDALEVLERFAARQAGIDAQVFAVLERVLHEVPPTEARVSDVLNSIIGNNAAAVDAAGIEAERRGYAMP